jgi:hypothetical protein
MSEQKPEVASIEHDPWNMFAWRSSIPLCDDLWLGMQAQNIAVVDRIVRHFEREALDEFYRNDRFSMDSLFPLSAMSQVWVFALYEFLRTWLQRASKLIGYAERMAALRTDGDRAAYMTAIEEEAKEKAKHVRLAPVFYHEHVARVRDEKFIESIRDYRESIKGLFRDVEAIRMPLAKHEIAGTKGQKFMAEAPGYGRVDTATGSMYWQIVLTNGNVDIINRHSLAGRFFGTEEPEEKSALFEDEVDDPEVSEVEMASSEELLGAVQEEKRPEKRRGRRGRRGGRRTRKTSKAVSLPPSRKKRIQAKKRRRLV